MATENAGASVTLENISKHYAGKAAVDDVSLEIRAGEFISLLGPSGSGKTTTLNLIAGFTPLTSGRIIVDGREVGDLPPHKRNVGVVFQHYALFPHLTAAENVGFPLRRRRMKKDDIRRRVADTLEMVRLTGLENRRPSELSGGQQQRVALARAIVFSPRLLLMDEPLGALDKKLRDWLQLEIKRLHQKLEITFVYVTHDQEEALAMSDRVAVFNEGRIEQLGAPRTLHERPETLFVGQFVGDSNLFPGVAADEPARLRCGERMLLVGADQHIPRGPCTVLVRPERLTVSRPPARTGANSLTGEVVQILYLGPHRKIEVRIDDALVLIAREGAKEPTDLSVGDRVHVSWDPNHAVTLDGHPERAADRATAGAEAI